MLGMAENQSFVQATRGMVIGKAECVKKLQTKKVQVVKTPNTTKHVVVQEPSHTKGNTVRKEVSKSSGLLVRKVTVAPTPCCCKHQFDVLKDASTADLFNGVEQHLEVGVQQGLVNNVDDGVEGLEAPDQNG